jgi:hypothetical protein
LENDFQVDVQGISDEQILHSAVGILRRDIDKLKISVEDYPKSPLFVRISRYRSAQMLIVHVDGMSLRMVVTWPGFLLFFVASRTLNLLRLE